MVFSLFGRKGKTATRKKAGGPSSSPPARRRDGQDTRTSIEEQRAAARLTSLKIDQIESEIMAGWESASTAGAAGKRAEFQAAPAAAVTVTPITKIAPVVAQKPAPAPRPAAQAAARPAPDKAPSVATTVLIGKSVGANAIDIYGSTLPEILEEAAILYANGHPQEAEAVLRQALDEPSAEPVRALNWMMLFDLLQSTGDRSAFDELALTYAARFEASAPGWDEDQAGSGADSGGAATSAFGLPARLDDSVAGVCTRINRALSRGGEVVIDCRSVRSVEPGGARQAHALIERCIASGQPVVIIQPETLGEAALAAIEVGRRDDSPACWLLAMLALRVRSERQRFEDLAIDYCVTYEVSPPSWEPVPETIRTERRSRPRGPEEPAYDARNSAFVFTGELSGALENELQALREYAAERGDVVIDCRNLRRVDFAAAGALLNAVVGLTGEGKKMLFVEPNHLVLALLMLMGIVDLVDVRRRRI